MCYANTSLPSNAADLLALFQPFYQRWNLWTGRLRLHRDYANLIEIPSIKDDATLGTGGRYYSANVLSILRRKLIRV